MKEYIKKEIKPNKYEYGYNLQKLDIKLMMDLGLEVPDKIKEVYKDGIDEEDLKEYIYFNDPISFEFISHQYYIRDKIEFSNMSLHELELLLEYFNKKINGLINIINKISKKDKLIDLETKLKILINEMQSVVYLRDELIDNYKVRK